MSLLCIVNNCVIPGRCAMNPYTVCACRTRDDWWRAAHTPAQPRCSNSPIACTRSSVTKRTWSLLCLSAKRGERRFSTRDIGRWKSKSVPRALLMVAKTRYTEISIMCHYFGTFSSILCWSRIIFPKKNPNKMACFYTYLFPPGIHYLHPNKHYLGKKIIMIII